MQGVFAAARAAAPAVVFIDEIDALAPARGGPNADSSAGEMTGRLVSTLLLAMEEGVLQRLRILGLLKHSTGTETTVLGASESEMPE